MKVYATAPSSSEPFFFERLTAASLDQAVELCDQAVGKNLYPRAQLATIVEDPDHYFYFLVTQEREVAGYIYFFLSDLASMAALSKLSQQQLSVMSHKVDPKIGNIQSIGVVQAYRNRKLSEMMVRFYLDKVEIELAADVAFSVLWRVGELVPMERTMKASGFSYLMVSRRVWYDNAELICPYCDGRCVCDADIYYKVLGSGERK